MMGIVGVSIIIPGVRMRGGVFTGVGAAVFASGETERGESPVVEEEEAWPPILAGVFTREGDIGGLALAAMLMVSGARMRRDVPFVGVDDVVFASGETEAGELPTVEEEEV